MEPVALAPEFGTTKIDGRIVAFYLRFRSGARWHQTHRFKVQNGGYVSVDTDTNNIPIGLQWINCTASQMVEAPASSAIHVEKIVLDLFAFASQIAAVGKDCQDILLKKKGDEILSEIIATIPALIGKPNSRLCA